MHHRHRSDSSGRLPRSSESSWNLYCPSRMRCPTSLSQYPCLVRLRCRPGKSNREEQSLLDSALLRKHPIRDRKSTRLNSSHVAISYAVFCLKKKKIKTCTQHL